MAFVAMVRQNRPNVAAEGDRRIVPPSGVRQPQGECEQRNNASQFHGGVRGGRQGGKTSSLIEFVSVMPFPPPRFPATASRSSPIASRLRAHIAGEIAVAAKGLADRRRTQPEKRRSLAMRHPGRQTARGLQLLFAVERRPRRRQRPFPLPAASFPRPLWRVARADSARLFCGTDDRKGPHAPQIGPRVSKR